MLLDWLAYWENFTPNKIGIIDIKKDNAYSYTALNQSANQTAYQLQSRYHLGKGDKISILSKNCVEYIYLFGAAQKIGVILVPLNYRLTAHEITQLNADLQPALTIYDEEFEDLVESQDAVSKQAFFEYQQSDGDSDYIACRELKPEDPIFILYTSGSSGKPKGAIYTHQMLFWNSVNTQVSLKLDQEVRTIVCMPPFHTGGWNVLLTPLLHIGGSAILMEKFEADLVLTLLEKYQCSVFMAVPTMLKMMLESPLFRTLNFEAVKYFIVGGEALPKPVIEQYQERGIPIRQGYGMTEVGPNLTSLHQDEAVRKLGSIGKANMYVQIRLVNDSFEDVPVNTPGELLLKGPMVTPGYYLKAEETKKAFHDGWFRTGDIAIQDEEGFYYIVDRIKNMFISGGENVYPLEVEQTLIKHPSIDEVIVIGVPHPKWGECGKAYIKPVANTTLSLEEIQGFCDNKLSKYKIPKFIELIEDFPKNDAGKIDRKALKSRSS